MRFNTSGCCSNHPLPIGLNRKVIGLMKDELGGAIMTEFVALMPELYWLAGPRRPSNQSNAIVAGSYICLYLYFYVSS